MSEFNANLDELLVQPNVIGKGIFAFSALKGRVRKGRVIHASYLEKMKLTMSLSFWKITIDNILGWLYTYFAGHTRIFVYPVYICLIQAIELNRETKSVRTEPLSLFAVTCWYVHYAENRFLHCMLQIERVIQFFTHKPTEIKPEFESGIPHVRFTATKLNIADTGPNTLGMLPKRDYRRRQSVSDRQSPLGTLHVPIVFYFHSYARIY